MRLTLLGYAQSRPHLRVLRLPAEEVVPSPVPLNRPVALDRCVVRDGWVAFDPDYEVWGVPLPLVGKAFKVGEWWQCLPAVNPRTVWLARPYEGDPALAVEYDGVARVEVGRVELPAGTSLAAAVPEGLVVALDDDDRLLLGDEPLAPGWQVVASRGSVLAVSHRAGGLSFVDASTRAVTEVEKPLPGGWNQNGSFSPDGSTFALGVAHEDSSARLAAALPGDLEWLTSPEEMMERLLSEPPAEDMIAALSSPSWTQLALVEVATGAVTLVEGRFDNFNSTPVWSADGRWCVFDAPFDKSLFACDVAERRLTPVVRRRGRVSPLADLTALDDV